MSSYILIIQKLCSRNLNSHVSRLGNTEEIIKRKRSNGNLQWEKILEKLVSPLTVLLEALDRCGAPGKHCWKRCKANQLTLIEGACGGVFTDTDGYLIWEINSGDVWGSKDTEPDWLLLQRGDENRGLWGLYDSSTGERNAVQGPFSKSGNQAEGDEKGWFSGN